MGKITKLTLIALFGVVLACAGGVKKANAVPNLGVGTEGIYYLENRGDTLDAYQSHWGATAVYNGVDHGFGLASPLHVWTYYLDTDVWLLAENSFSDNSLNFDGMEFMEKSPGGIFQSISTYDINYWGVNLGNPTSNSTKWTLLPDPPFSDGPSWEYVGALTYSSLTDADSGKYLFAISDGGDGSINGGEFSPPTTGAVNGVIPEPTTILLLGIGLAGLAGVGARRKWKKKAVDKI